MLGPTRLRKKKRERARSALHSQDLVRGGGGGGGGGLLPPGPDEPRKDVAGT